MRGNKSGQHELSAFGTVLYFRSKGCALSTLRKWLIKLRFSRSRPRRRESVPGRWPGRSTFRSRSAASDKRAGRRGRWRWKGGRGGGRGAAEARTGAVGGFTVLAGEDGDGLIGLDGVLQGKADAGAHLAGGT